MRRTVVGQEKEREKDLTVGVSFSIEWVEKKFLSACFFLYGGYLVFFVRRLLSLTSVAC